MNRKASEEKFQNNQGVIQIGNNNLYNAGRKPSIEQRYKSHLRG